jgi:hypothetical protein
MLYGKAGFVVSYRDDGIIQYHFADITRATIDTWVEIAHQHDMDALASGKHLLRMNTAHPKLIPTPYALSRAGYLNSISPAITESQAFIMSNNIAYHLVGTFVNSMGSQLKYGIRIYRTEAEGIAWLLKRAAEIPVKPSELDQES